jgi:large subunit ribosomal protein L30
MDQFKKVIVEQTRSGHGRTKIVRSTLAALGLGRIGKKREHALNPAVYGMLRQVRHLVEVREV